jgi:chlorite dismutase
LHTRVAYYSNTTASRQLLLVCGDVESNPGWETDASQTNSMDYLQNFAEGISHCKNNMNIAHVNIRSLRNKVDKVRLLLKIYRFDILALTETHLDSSISNQQLEIEIYRLIL